MNVAEQLAILAELCHLDAKLKKTRDIFAQVPAHANSVKNEAETLAVKLVDLKKKRFAVDQERNRKDQEVQTIKDNIRKWEQRAQALRGEREYTALQSEIAGRKREIARIEDFLVDAMQKIEDFDANIDKLEAQYQEKKKAADAEFANVKEQMQNLQENIDEMNDKRQQHLSALPVPFVRQYERVLAKRQGAAIAIVTKEICSGCRCVLPPQFRIKIQRSEVVESCPSCQRFLVHESLVHHDATTAASASTASAVSAAPTVPAAPTAQ